jgi:hypothetical protein
MNRVQKNLLLAVGFLAIGGGAGVYTLVAKVKTPEERMTEQANAQRFFRFGRVDVVQGELYAKTATITFARAESGWRLKSPIDWPADQESIEAMLDRMTALRIDPVITEDAGPEDLRNSGLDRPPVRVSVQLKDGSQKTLSLGRLNTMSGKYPATDQDQKRIGLTRDDSYWAFNRSAFELRQKRLIPVANSAITQVQLEGAVPLQLSRGEQGWRIGDEQADSGLTELFLTQLTVHLKAERFLTDTFRPEEAAQFGLDRPLTKLTVVAGDRRFELHFANFQETGAPDGTLVAWPVGSKTVAAVANGLREALNQTPETLRDRLISRYDPAKATRLELQVGAAAPFAAVRLPDGRWVIDEPAQRPAKTFVINALINGYSGVRANGVVSVQASAKELEQWKLEPWAWRVVVKDQAGATLADVRLGDYLGDTELYAKNAEGRRVYRVSDNKAKVIPATVDGLAE